MKRRPSLRAHYKRATLERYPKKQRRRPRVGTAPPQDRGAEEDAQKVRARGAQGAGRMVPLGSTIIGALGAMARLATAGRAAGGV